MNPMIPEMTQPALTDLLDRMGIAGIPVWLDGGWGVDALLGEQTRPHRDVDVVALVSGVPRLIDLLAAAGFAVREGEMPHAFVLADGKGLEVDVHAIKLDTAGNGVYRMENGQDWIYPAEGFEGEGRIGGIPVRCLSPATQILCHAHGYVPAEKDFRDMERLADRFGLELPPRLRRAVMRGPAFRAIRAGDLVVEAITEGAFDAVRDELRAAGADDGLVAEFERSYRMVRDDEGRLTKIGFLARLAGRPAGVNLLGVSSWTHQRGYTGADTLPALRGQGVAPRTKPALFYVGFALFGLNRIETGCVESNAASRGSIEKTPGFVYEGTLRQFARVGADRYEDERRYAILKSDWERLYDVCDLELLP